MAGALVSPKGKRRHWKWPQGQAKAVLGRSFSATDIWWNPDERSKFETTLILGRLKRSTCDRCRRVSSQASRLLSHHDDWGSIRGRAGLNDAALYQIFIVGPDLLKMMWGGGGGPSVGFCDGDIGMQDDPVLH